MKYAVTKIRGRAREAAAEALRATLEARAPQILVHFDVDVIDASDFPAADVLHTEVCWPLAKRWMYWKVSASISSFAGLDPTEFNSVRDPDGTLAQRMVEAVVGIFSRRASVLGKRNSGLAWLYYDEPQADSASRNLHLKKGIV